MSNSANLLRLLEPAVRPVTGQTAPKDRAGQVPFESQDFATLLAQADTQDTEGGQTPALSDTTKPSDPLASLNRIENASLRNLMATTRDNTT